MGDRPSEGVRAESGSWVTGEGGSSETSDAADHEQHDQTAATTT